MRGLEPPTPGTTIQCSNRLSYTHHMLDFIGDWSRLLQTANRARRKYITNTAGNKPCHGRGPYGPFASTTLMGMACIKFSEGTRFDDRLEGGTTLSDAEPFCGITIAASHSATFRS